MLEQGRPRNARSVAPLLALALLVLPAASGCAGATPPPESAVALPAASDGTGGATPSSSTETSTSALPWPTKLDHPSTPETQRRAVNELFEMMHMQQVLDAALDASIKAQMAGNPTLRRFEPLMRKFMAKYLSLDGIREPMTRLYVARFSELEIVQLTAFYRTPLGQRTLAELPKIIEEGGKIGMNLVKDHLDELMAMVRQQVEREGGSP